MITISVIYIVENSYMGQLRTNQSSRDTVLLLTNPDTAETVNEQGQILDVDLKFNPNFPIEGTYKINPNGDLLVYWTDNKNPPRALNVTRQRSLVHLISPNQSS